MIRFVIGTASLFDTKIQDSNMEITIGTSERTNPLAGAEGEAGKSYKAQDLTLHLQQQ